MTLASSSSSRISLVSSSGAIVATFIVLLIFLSKVVVRSYSFLWMAWNNEILLFPLVTLG